MYPGDEVGPHATCAYRASDHSTFLRRSFPVPNRPDPRRHFPFLTDPILAVLSRSQPTRMCASRDVIFSIADPTVPRQAGGAGPPGKDGAAGTNGKPAAGKPGHPLAHACFVIVFSRHHSHCGEAV